MSSLVKSALDRVLGNFKYMSGKKEPWVLAVGVLLGIVMRQVGYVRPVVAQSDGSIRSSWMIENKLNQAFLESMQNKLAIDELRALLAATNEDLEVTRVERDMFQEKLKDFQAKAAEAISYMLELKQWAVDEAPVIQSERQHRRESSSPRFSSRFLEADAALRRLVEDEFFVGMTSGDEQNDGSMMGSFSYEASLNGSFSLGT